jgi:hypothetical protein
VYDSEVEVEQVFGSIWPEFVDAFIQVTAVWAQQFE